MRRSRRRASPRSGSDGLSDDLIGEALAHHNAGRLAEAEDLYRRAIIDNPDNANAWYLLGLALRQGGRNDEALAALDAAIRIAPSAVEPRFNRAVTALALGRRDEAETGLRQATAIKPDFVEGRALLGQVLLDQGAFAAAAAELEAALATQPDHKGAAINHGLALQRAGRNVEAIEAFRKACRLAPDNGDVHRCLAGLLTDQGGGAEAARIAEKATALAPRNEVAWYVLGAASESITDLDQAAEAYGRAIDIVPDYVDAAIRLAHLNANRCDWRDGGKAARQVIALSQRLPVWPWAIATLASSAAEQKRAAEVWAAAKTARGAPRKPFRQRPTKAPLRIGYLSADFHQHATAWLVAEIFERHDRRRVEVFGLSLGPDDASPLRRRLVAAFDRFVDLAGMDDEAATRQVGDLDLDILVDLKGWTQNARPEILARRPAPIQVAWLGYPGTMGAEWIDYVLADGVVLPPSLDAHFTEAVARLPDSYQPNDTRRHVAAIAPRRADWRLPETDFVFCCFNNIYKLSRPIFDVWMRLLAGVPGSVLWLLSPHEFPKPHLKREARSRGIDPERIVFADALPQDQHLARLPLADLFLDTLPVNAHTTASDALWMGLPLVTCAGEAFVGRVAASLLAATGLRELITDDLRDYESLALSLAQDPARLAAIRARLKDARSSAPLFDTARMARHIEDAFEMMARRALAGEATASFDVPARP